MASHDSDSRYNSPESKARIASIYLPLLSVVMESHQHLYNGWKCSSGVTSPSRSSVILNINVDGDSAGDSVSFQCGVCNILLKFDTF